jgi:hypothetical protein
MASSHGPQWLVWIHGSSSGVRQGCRRGPRSKGAWPCLFCLLLCLLWVVWWVSVVGVGRAGLAQVRVVSPSPLSLLGLVWRVGPVGVCAERAKELRLPVCFLVLLSFCLFYSPSLCFSIWMRLCMHVRVCVYACRCMHGVCVDPAAGAVPCLGGAEPAPSQRRDAARGRVWDLCARDGQPGARVGLSCLVNAEGAECGSSEPCEQ